MTAHDTRVHLSLLGGIELTGVRPEAADAVLAQPKLVALLALLALTPDARMQRRDRLIGMLWPELDQAHARAALRKALHAIRSFLGAHVLRARGDEEVALDRSAIGCDAVDLVTATDAEHLMQAVELYRGELLPGFHLPDCAEFDRWLEDERNELRERAAAATWALARRLEETDQYTAAGLMARRTVRYCWDDERVLRRTLSMLVRIGDRAGALSLYDEFAERMRRELSATPSAETTALAETLRS